jgi:hypothetical protein
MSNLAESIPPGPSHYLPKDITPFYSCQYPLFALKVKHVQQCTLIRCLHKIKDKPAPLERLGQIQSNPFLISWPSIFQVKLIYTSSILTLSTLTSPENTTHLTKQKSRR